MNTMNTMNPIVSYDNIGTHDYFYPQNDLFFVESGDVMTDTLRLSRSLPVSNKRLVDELHEIAKYSELDRTENVLELRMVNGKVEPVYKMNSAAASYLISQLGLPDSERISRMFNTLDFRAWLSTNPYPEFVAPTYEEFVASFNTPSGDDITDLL